jgi:hypothetical protein
MATDGRRRAPRNVIEAIAGSGSRGLGLLREVHAASITGKPARQVDDDGVPVDETRAERAWLDSDSQFARVARRGRSDDPQPEPDPEPETDHSRFVCLHGQLLDQLLAAKSSLESARGALDEMTELKASTPDVALDDTQRQGLESEIEELVDGAEQMFPLLRGLRERRSA